MPSEGNLRPRIQEVRHNGDYAILNSLGLPTKGVANFLPLINNKKLTKFNRPIGVSIGGNSSSEYFSVFKDVESHLNTLDFSQFFYEINISCPNTDDGKCLSDDLDNLKHLILKFREISSRVIIVKVSPDSTDQEVLKICEPEKGGLFIDCTYGAGGYSNALLSFPNTKVIALDRDENTQELSLIHI